MSRTLWFTLGLAAMGVLPSSAAAQDPVTLYPRNYKVLFENERVRVLDFVLRKGDTEVMHAHPANVVYVLAPFKIRFTLPDGSTRVREVRAGDVLYSDAIMHSPLNIGETDAHGILVEMKGTASDKPAASGVPAGLRPAGADMLTAFTFIHGLPGKEEDLKEHLLSLTAPTRAEAGAIRYDLYQSASKPHEFLRYEVWQDAESLEAHKQTAPLRASFEKRQREGWSTEITIWKPVTP